MKLDRHHRGKNKSLNQSNNKHSNSEKKIQLIDFYNDINDEEEDFNECLQMKSYIEAQWDEIHQAINENNADLLYALLPPVNLYNGKEKYWLPDCYRYEHYKGENILLRAVELEHIDCIKVILDKIRSKDLPSTIFYYDSWWGNYRTPLLTACEKGNLNIVKMLIEFDPMQYIRSNAFFIAFERGDEKLMNYLVSRCDLRKSMHHDRTVLDCVISRGYIEIAKHLIYYGDTERNRDGFSPMMLAVHHDLNSLVDLLFQRLPFQEAIDELILLACHYIIDGDEQNRQKAFNLFVRGLTESEPLEIDVSHEVYDNHRECKTVDELLAIWNDENAMRMHALIVSERILLRLGDIGMFLKFINQQSNFYRSNQLFHRIIQLNVHAYHLTVHYQFNQKVLLDWQQQFFDKVIKDLYRVWNKTKTIPIELIEMVLTCLFNTQRVAYLSCMFDLLATIVYMMQLITTKSHERRLLFTIARRIMQHDTMGNSLLVQYILQYATRSSIHELPQNNVPVLSVIGLMIQCDANVNEISNGNWRNHMRPLHATTACRDIDIAKPIIELLLANGAHADCPNDEGRLAQDLTRVPAMKELLSPTRTLSLKCRCAQVIVSKTINYQNYLSPNLLAFVQLHTSLQTNKSSRDSFESLW